MKTITSQRMSVKIARFLAVVLVIGAFGGVAQAQHVGPIGVVVRAPLTTVIKYGEKTYLANTFALSNGLGRSYVTAPCPSCGTDHGTGDLFIVRNSYFQDSITQALQLYMAGQKDRVATERALQAAMSATSVSLQPAMTEAAVLALGAMEGLSQDIVTY